MSDVFGELRDSVRAAALDHTLEPADRHAKLSALRDQLLDVFGELERYRADAQKIREADVGQHALEQLWVRQNASIREELIAAGELTAEEADAMGLLSHVELDRLQEEGLLEEAATSIARRWEETLGGGRTPTAGGRQTPEGGKQQRPKPGERPPMPAEEPAPTAAPATGHEDLGQHHAERALRALADYHATKAEGAERGLTDALQAAVTENGGSLEGLENRLKSRASITAKIRSRREKMPLASEEEVAQSLPDYVRYTASFPAGGYNRGVEQTIAALDGQGYKQVEYHNYWGGSDAYDGLHVGLRAPNGTMVELQFHTPESVTLRDETLPPLLEKFRGTTDAHERWNVWQQMIEAVNAVAIPRGAEELGPA